MPAIANADPAELAKFSAMAERWWDPNGPMKPLHAQGPTRLRAILDAIEARHGRSAEGEKRLAGLRIVAVGCGGGLLCEPLARLGAEMLGVDGSLDAIAAAQAHAAAGGLEIAYRVGSAADLVAEGARFDVVLSMEVIEHTNDPRRFVDDCAALVADGGVFVGSTLNRTLKSLALAKIGAEYVLRWLPIGTHDWRKFVTPREFARYLRTAGLRVTDRRGIILDPLKRGWRLSARDLDVNYAIVAERG